MLFNNKMSLRLILTILPALFFISCKKLIEVEPPVTSASSASVYRNDAMAISIMTNVYAHLSDGFSEIFILGGLCSDELAPYYENDSYRTAFYRNNLLNNSGGVEAIWSAAYNKIFTVNSVIEGLTGLNSITPAVKQQLLGEAKFMRAFYYFYIVNFYGDAPLVTSTDYKVNLLLPRASAQQIYNLIISDLKEAQELLDSNYVDATLINSTIERVRPNKWTATALLSRVYLYREQWANAEEQASLVIDNKMLYDTLALENVFLKDDNREAIWHLPSTGILTQANTIEGRIFVIPDSTVPDYSPVRLSAHIYEDFEPGDQRRKNWVDSVVANVDNNYLTYHFSAKYKIGSINTTATEYRVVFRLAEQYLIRSEARARQGKLTGENSADGDLNVIRKRAGLPPTDATDSEMMIDAIIRERKSELFTEWGHRWLDLKRADNVDALMTTITSDKGGTWQSYQKLFPLPANDLARDPNLEQNPGY
jgi:starch-binding outer membrane protein, SusD/RagB family